MPKPCPSCGSPTSGRFCSDCGASVSKDATCSSCSAALLPGSKFCTECGTAAAGETAATRVSPVPAATTRSVLPWGVAVAAVLILGVIVWYPRAAAESFGGDGFQSHPMGVTSMSGAGPQAIDLSAMSPREAADRLFDRVMRTAAAGDSADARSFVPMALNAYAVLPEQDGDSRYHIGALHLLAGDAAAAAEQASVLLGSDANHLFGLFVAAQATRDQGMTGEARGYYQRFLDAYPSEIGRDLPEYQAHSAAFPEMRAEAQAFTVRNP
jgi:hypothetical protein